MDLIVNYVAGGKHGKKVKKTLSVVEARLKEKNIDYTVHHTKYKGHGTLLTKQLIENGATQIVVLGGDGTLHEVINGFSNFENVCLGLVPCGTGNDFAHAMGIPLDAKKAIDLIIDGTPQFTDFIQLPTVRGINVVGMGVDVDVLVRYSKLKRKNKFGYTWCLIKTLLNFNYVDFKVEVDGEIPTEHHAFIVAIANGSVFGGGIPICPIANPLDKTLNLVTVDQIKRSKILFALIKLLKGKILTLPQANHKTCQKVKIIPNGDYVVNVDGELYPNIPFDVQIISDKLKMYK